MTGAALPSTPSVAQLAAIDASGWGHTVRIFQPRNFASWIFLWYLILGAVATVQWFAPGFGAVRTATIWGLLLFALYTLPWLWFLRHFDCWTPIPAKLLLSGFLWGGLTATFFIALPANTALLGIYNKAVSAAFAQDWGPGLAAPFTEETGKGIGILLLMFIAPRIIRTSFDGFIVGAFVGLGFEVVEDILYVVNTAVAGFGADQFGAATHIFIVRGLAGFFSHALFSAIYGTGLVLLVGTLNTRPNRLRGIGLILLAMVAHGCWDAMAAMSGEFGLNVGITMLGIALIELVAILIVLRWVSGSERTWMRALMSPEVDRGTITEAELDVLSGSRKDRTRFLKTFHDRGQRRSTQHVLDATVDLAEALSRSGGRDTPDVTFARSEVTRVRRTPLQLAAA